MKRNSTYLDRAVEFADNGEQRCACVLLVDTSDSMKGAPIQALNEGIRQFKTSLLEDALASKRVDIAIVSFNSEVVVQQDFVTPDALVPPNLTADGETQMGQAILKAYDMVQARKADYDHYGVMKYRPWIFLITDGAPTDDTSAAEQRLKEGEENKRVAFFAVGVDGANMAKLSRMSVRPPVKLNGLNFGEMFEWLSRSLQKVAASRPEEGVNVGWGEKI
jgi:uncharacterized protein YegL